MNVDYKSYITMRVLCVRLFVTLVRFFSHIHWQNWLSICPSLLKCHAAVKVPPILSVLVQSFDSCLSAPLYISTLSNTPFARHTRIECSPLGKQRKLPWDKHEDDLQVTTDRKGRYLIVLPTPSINLLYSTALPSPSPSPSPLSAVKCMRCNVR